MQQGIAGYDGTSEGPLLSATDQLCADWVLPNILQRFLERLIVSLPRSQDVIVGLRLQSMRAKCESQPSSEMGDC
jgi:hypothetical protein